MIRLYRLVSVNDVSNRFHIIFQDYEIKNVFMDSFDKVDYEFNENIFLRTEYDGENFNLYCNLNTLTSFQSLQDLINGDHGEIL